MCALSCLISIAVAFSSRYDAAHIYHAISGLSVVNITNKVKAANPWLLQKKPALLKMVAYAFDRVNQAVMHCF